jgi:O-methyltransferase domain/Dimerisation domain
MIDVTAGLEPPTSDDRLIWDVWLSVYHFPTLAVADALGVFPLLKEASASSEEVAEQLSLGPRATEALLGVLTSLGFLEQRRSRFHLTDVARDFLLPNSPYYWGGILELVRDIPFTCSSLREALRKDKPIGYEGDDIWETHELDPEQARLFTQAMHSHSFPAAVGAARHGDFTEVRRLLDVGGGSGAFCIALAQRYPEMRFTVAELPVVCTLAEEYVAHYGLQDRIDTAALDMFGDPWPSGYDAHFLSNVFHDWSREHCRLLARQSFESLPSGGRIYLHEMLLEDTRDDPLAATSFSMNMIFFTQGKQFTAGELEELLGEAGFEEIALKPTYGYYSLVTGRKL